MPPMERIMIFHIKSRSETGELLDLERVRPELTQTFLDAVLQHAHCGHDGNDREDADNDPEEGERRAEFVRPDGRQ